MDIPPAHETGEYYILVANVRCPETPSSPPPSSNEPLQSVLTRIPRQLPFGCTWRCLKDFTRTVCEPAFVTVFQDSTCGWVKVSGRENFDKAWGRVIFHEHPSSSLANLAANTHQPC